MTDTQRYNFEQGKLADWVKVFSRTSSVPLDRSQLFDSYEDALAYAQGDGSDHRGIGKTAWVGQPISVVENNVAKFYIISEKSTVVNEETVVERVLESVGSSVEFLANFTVQNGNVTDATTDKVGSLVYITGGSASYPKGLYIITGANTVAAFATTDNLRIVKKQTANSGASATYELQLNGVKQGVDIDIPKDLVVSSGSIVTFTAEDELPDAVTTAGTYIKLTLANSGGDLYINVNSLIDAYTSDDNYINISGYKISLNFNSLVSAIIADSNFISFIGGYIDVLETSIDNVESIAKKSSTFDFDIEVNSDNIKFSLDENVNSEQVLEVKVISPKNTDTYTINNIEFYSSAGVKLNSTKDTQNEDLYKISFSELKNLFADSCEIILNCKIFARLSSETEVYTINKFIRLYSNRQVFIGQCSSEQFLNLEIDIDTLSEFGYVPEVKNLKSVVKITADSDSLTVNSSEEASTNQYVLIALKLFEETDNEFTNINVKSNGFVIPFEKSSSIFTDNSSYYSCFKSKDPVILGKVDNIEIEFYTK